MNKKGDISNHITYAEATRSRTAERLGIKNVPTEAELKAMKLLAEKVFEPLRLWYGKPITITSFYRNAKINVRIGGSPTSQHCKGEAIDIDTVSDNGKLFDSLLRYSDFDQLIWEHGNDNNPDWIHVSYKSAGNRRQVLRATKNGAGKTVYSTYTRKNA